MATQVYNGSASIGTTPFSLPNNSTTLTPMTDAQDVSAWVKFASLAVADRFQVEILDKMTGMGDAQETVEKFIVQGPGSPVILTPFIPLIHGWDIRVTKLSGTDRTVTWSLRKPG